MWNKILTIPFFICIVFIPVGLLLLLMMFNLTEGWIRDYGEWSFKQWENNE